MNQYERAQKKIGKVVRGWMIKNGISQVELSRKSTICQGQISRLLNGRQGWRLEALMKVAKALGSVKPSTILRQAGY